VVRVGRLAPSIVIGLSAAVLTVLGIYSVALTEPGDENRVGPTPPPKRRLSRDLNGTRSYERPT
jgi:hypothetical protein